ncbi:sensor histidine kinase [Tepidimicrobium xylanilyticum]
MDIWIRFNNILRKVLFIIFFTDIFSRNRGNRVGLIIYAGLLVLVIINDYLRYKHLYKSSRTVFYVSIIVSIGLGSVLTFFVGGNITIYLFMILVDIAFLKDVKALKYLYTINALAIIFVPLFRFAWLDGISILQVILESPRDFLMMVILVLFSSASVFSYRALLIEKNRVEKLNKEIEKLTISKERNRVAQEIHDNIGHNLIALNMNLDVLFNMVDKEDKLNEIIVKCQRLTKDSVENLRRAVYALKDESIFENFSRSLEELRQNIADNSNIQIEYDIDPKIEDFSPEYKNILYTTIKESITNSIKHGKANKVNIDIEVGDRIQMRIKDNGIGCEEIVKGNGLVGIEERISRVNGQIRFITEKNKGFRTEIILPI